MTSTTSITTTITVEVDADLLATIKALRAEEKRIADEKRAAEAKVRNILAEAGATTAVGGDLAVTLVDCEREVVDRDLLAEMFPEAKEATTKVVEFQQMRFTPVK